MLFCPKEGQMELRFLPCPLLSVESGAFLLFFFLHLDLWKSKGEKTRGQRNLGWHFLLFACCLNCNQCLILFEFLTLLLEDNAGSESYYNSSVGHTYYHPILRMCVLGPKRRASNVMCILEVRVFRFQSKIPDA